MSDFSVYYQVYNNKTATDNILYGLRRVYDNVHVRLVSDNGADHTDLAKKYNCEYIHDSFRVGLWGKNHKDVISGKHCFGWNKEESLVFLSRWLNLAKSVKTKYLLFVEDDIEIHKRISIIDKDFPFTQIYPDANIISDKFVSFLNKHKPNHTYFCYGCCAGHFLNRELFIDCLDSVIPFLEKYYYIIQSLEKRIGWCDALLNFVFNFHGYVGLFNYEYRENQYNKQDVAILHNTSQRSNKWTIYNKIS